MAISLLLPPPQAKQGEGMVAKAEGQPGSAPEAKEENPNLFLGESGAGERQGSQFYFCTQPEPRLRLALGQPSL